MGGFWSIAASLAMRLVPAQDLPKALAIVTGAVSVALVAAAPMGSFLRATIGWRGAFGVAGLLAAIGLVWQFFALPSMPSLSRADTWAVIRILKLPGVGLPDQQRLRLRG
jgi:predicted MFS family arabinose efflux permease